MSNSDAELFDDQVDSEEEEEDVPLPGEYDITTAPNDFNIATIIDSVRRGIFVIPGFQRNFVWDLKRSSKLIESILLGLPVPQIFLYREARNKFLVIDGQQRLMSIYFFARKRFPKMEKRGELRKLYDTDASLSDKIIEDDDYFDKFNLRLPSRTSTTNRFDGLNYDTLDAEQDALNYKTMRCVVITQNRPKKGNSSVYEIFSRLNTGGVNLSAQELRSSLYHSEFYDMIHNLNLNPHWRRIVGAPEPDLRMRDIEVLIRIFGICTHFQEYASSMNRFLNDFSDAMKGAGGPHIVKMRDIFLEFFEVYKDLPLGSLKKSRSSRVNVPLLEALAATSTAESFHSGAPVASIAVTRINALRDSNDFRELTRAGSTHKSRIRGRLELARKVLLRED